MKLGNPSTTKPMASDFDRIGRVIWITGLSGAGKSTLSVEIATRLRETCSAVVLLDGDNLREVFGTATPSATNYSRDRRLALAFQYAHLCRILASQNLIVIIATISLFSEVHAWNRTHLPGYFEVYLRVPLEELRRRDPKGIYRRFDTGELIHVAGLDLPVDEPDAADLVLDFSPDRPVSALADALIDQLTEKTVI